MKKLLLLLLTAFLSFTTLPTTSWATPQEDSLKQDSINKANATAAATTELPPATEPVVELTAHQLMKKYFIDGGWQYMAIILVCLIFGLAIAIERVIMLSLASVNSKKLMEKLQTSIASGDIEGAKNICKTTPGPIAEVLGEGLRRIDDGIDGVEKTIVANASVQTGLLQKGLVWISLNIAMAPMLGFFGTVVGMIFAFDAIEAAGDIRPSDVAGGIKVALLTTVLGLVVAMILQVFYNYITSKVDGIINDMEDATISLIDILIDNGHAQPKGDK